jgi:hypothetical protein
MPPQNQSHINADVDGKENNGGDREGGYRPAGSLDLLNPYEGYGSAGDKNETGFGCGECLHCMRNKGDNGNRRCIKIEEVLTDNVGSMLDIGKYKVKFNKKLIPTTTKGLSFPFLELRKYRITVWQRMDAIDDEKAEIGVWKQKYEGAMDAINDKRAIHQQMVKTGDDGKVQTVDEHGNFHTEEDTGMFVDTNLYHLGTVQRVAVDILEPFVSEKLVVVQRRYQELGIEKAYLLKWLHLRPCIPLPIQTMWRGCAARFDQGPTRRAFWRCVEYAAAITIQTTSRRWAGCKKGWEWMRYIRVAGEGGRRVHAAAPIQRVFRGFLARSRSMELRLLRRREAEEWAAQTIQRHSRARLSRAVYNDLATEQALLSKTEQFTGSVMAIQAVMRSYLARKVVQQRRVEAALDPQVRRLADKYIAKGDFWTFLMETNAAFKRHKEDMQRENEMAQTFVKEVLAKRDAEYSGAWDDWAEGKPGAEEGAHIKRLQEAPSGHDVIGPKSDPRGGQKQGGKGKKRGGGRGKGPPEQFKDLPAWKVSGL